MTAECVSHVPRDCTTTEKYFKISDICVIRHYCPHSHFIHFSFRLNENMFSLLRPLLLPSAPQTLDSLHHMDQLALQARFDKETQLCPCVCVAGWL